MTTIEATSRPRTLQPAIRSRGRAVVACVFPALVCALPFLAGTPQYFVWATTAIVWGMWVLSLNVIWGLAGQLSMAQVALGGIGGYVFVVSLQDWSRGLVVSILSGVLASLAAALVLSSATLRLRGFYFTVLTLAFALTVTVVFSNWDIFGRTGGLSIPRSVLPEVALGPVHLDPRFDFGDFYVVAAVIFVLMNALVIVIQRTAAGRALEAVRDDEYLAVSVGINAFHMKTLALLFSGAIAGVAGIVHVLSFQIAVPELFSLDQALTALMLLVIAGRGHTYAPVAAALMYLVIYELLPVDGELRLGILGAIVILVGVCYPEGVLGVVAKQFRRRAKRSRAHVLRGSDGHEHVE